MELDVTFRVSDLNLGGFKWSLKGKLLEDVCVIFFLGGGLKHVLSLPLPEKMHHF